MALTKDQVINKGLESLETEKGKEIFNYYFLNEISQDEVKEIMNKKERVRDTQVLSNLISGYTSGWKELGYITERKVHNLKSKSKFHPNKLVYTATIKPLIDYCENILSNLSIKEKISRGEILKIPEELRKRFKRKEEPTKEELKEYSEPKFTKIEKEILEHIFSFKKVREIVCNHNSILQGMVSFLERIFFHKSILDDVFISSYFGKSFFIKNKMYVKKWKSREEKFFNFHKAINKNFHKLFIKIKIVSNFSAQEYFDLIVKTELRKYQYISSLIQYKKSINKMEDLVIFDMIYETDKIPPNW
ncbi:hypothetical protein J4429_04995 [Candidatus Pacearchaeota archaeon]|nr:hypothetical protein [Candidatus Pacearchaeota archaeon]